MATVEEYKAAMNELAAATAAFAPIDTYLQKIREAIGYSGGGNLSFLGSTFGLKYQRGQGRYHHEDPKHRLDLTKWPSADEVRSAGVRLATAYNSAHDIYAALPADDREYVKSPPYQVMFTR